MLPGYLRRECWGWAWILKSIERIPILGEDACMVKARAARPSPADRRPKDAKSLDRPVFNSMAIFSSLLPGKYPIVEWITTNGRP
jgi:hypothetical protein